MDTKFCHCGGTHCFGHSDLNECVRFASQWLAIRWTTPLQKEPPLLSEPAPIWVGTGYLPPIGLCTTNDHPTDPPTQPRACIYSPLPERTGIWSLFLLQQTNPKPHSIYSCTNLSDSDLPFSILTSEPNIITIQQLLQSVSPQMLSLSMPWPHTTLQQTSNDVIGLISNVIAAQLKRMIGDLQLDTKISHSMETTFQLY